MMPHMLLTPWDREPGTDDRTSFLLLLDPAVFVDLLAARDTERAGRHVLDDRRAGGDVGPLADPHRSDQLRVAADEGAVLDHRRMLVRAVVVARDGAGADVDLLADRRVAEIRQ